MRMTTARLALTSIFGAALACSSIMAGTPVRAQSNCPKVTRPEIAALFDRWNNSLQTGDPNKVTLNYAGNAVLLPTVSNKVRRNHEEIQDYFVKFLQMKPVGKINYRNIRLYCGVAIDSGIYTFRVINNGQTQEVPARYTFVYNKLGDKWLITEHHSSGMPETTTTK
ncbi:SgcJ/EcaC family oxidoreductase [Umezakia ovalisporum]|uniref:SgcJ/EcaC family oxidoreductase n=1 Tax=Umezakia ovalisporum FSS-62 TaxID=2971776 RepID=A0AA43GVW9_9CYAN|nr:SgcJ/EcaC family oxidoreductase [Umezakia ovalisporum]MBI1241315.1 SgcJ/EcaC family oxidoreductase [Nostoc sp. RI_552]MDH6062616.1 SgcJ/EcaC family oxidoreductase [Umezakia ovalisporum FSS-62]MDH6066404.1 SgcJ/EcaC family oxidoreductase [Umezakia ovalisporum APH033B]MDH6079327.1 SgcJ/EcaC family oxidoreductase [Umezakia ovalisporum FSS-45]MDH6084110.1 SgcJ/EcaC family oxidoreductase [Umezakia ovalisporum TAC611]